MVLFLGGKQLSKRSSILTEVLHHPKTVESAKEFCQKEVIQIPQKSHNLYIFQHEFGTIRMPSKLEWLGTQDATTCNMVILRSPITGTASCAHFDGQRGQIGGNRCSFRSMVSTFQSNELENGLDVYVAGGFRDDRGYSINIANQLIQSMDEVEIPCHLKLFCSYLHNDVEKDGEHFPKVYGMAIHLPTGNVVPAYFEAYSPDSNIRGLQYLGKSPLCNVVDTDREEVVIPPFDYLMSTSYVKRLLELSDEEYLQNHSTSPHAEPPHFVKVSKENLQFMLDYPNPDTIFPGRQPRRWKRDYENCKWVRADILEQSCTFFVTQVGSKEIQYDPQFD